MQTEELQTSNNVKVSGTVIEKPIFSHNLFGEGFYTFKVSVKRLSEKEDILPITISERLFDLSLINVGTNVKIDGQIRSYNNYDEIEKRNKLIITIFARNLEIFDGNDEFIDINDIVLDGFICKAPVYRTTPFGREIADVLLAVNRSYNKSDYIPCISWGRNAKFCEQLSVGSSVRICGRLQSRVYQKKMSDNEVIQKIAYEISVTKIEHLKQDLAPSN